MTGEVSARTIVFSAEYPKTEDPEAYTQFMREDVTEGRIDGVLLNKALENLQYCTEEPRAKFYMFIRRWGLTPELEARYTLPDFHIHDPASGMVEDQSVDADKIPRDTMFLFDRLYTLTGAGVVLDDLADGVEYGAVIRRGSYNGSPVYFREAYDELSEDSVYFNPGTEGQRSLGIEIMGEQRGEIVLTELSKDQKALLAHIIGSKAAASLSDPHIPGEWDQVPAVNRGNFSNVRELVGLAFRHRRERLLQQNWGARILSHLGFLKTEVDLSFPAED